jgi:hypothetical protein
MDVRGIDEADSRGHAKSTAFEAAATKDRLCESLFLCALRD